MVDSFFGKKHPFGYEINVCESLRHLPNFNRSIHLLGKRPELFLDDYCGTRQNPAKLSVFMVNFCVAEAQSMLVGDWLEILSMCLSRSFQESMVRWRMVA